jgi:hypothetical protein
MQDETAQLVRETAEGGAVEPAQVRGRVDGLEQRVLRQCHIGGFGWRLSIDTVDDEVGQFDQTRGSGAERIQ